RWDGSWCAGTAAGWPRRSGPQALERRRRSCGLFLPELVEGDDRGLGRLGWRGFGGLGVHGSRRGLNLLRRGRRGLELQQELHGRIVEAGDRRVGDRQALGLAAEL